MKKICKSIQSIALVVMFASIIVSIFVPAFSYVAIASMLTLAFAAIAEPQSEPSCPTIFTKQYHDQYYTAA